MARANMAVSIVFIIAAAFTGSSMGAMPHAQTAVDVPGAKYLFGISTSPSGHALILYRSRDFPEGELTSGTAVLVKLKSSPEVLPLRIPSAVEDAAPSVWSNDGHTSYVLTSAGIYAVDTIAVTSKLIVPGAIAGLAISADGTRLAYWDLGTEGAHYTLSVINTNTNKLIKTWRIPTRFASDQYGHEIAFSYGGSVLYARTYNKEGRTPLKRFNIKTGRVRTVWPDCTGLATGPVGVYFIGSDRSVNTLFKITTASTSIQKVMTPFPFDTLINSGPRRWLIAINERSGKLGLFGSETGKLVPVNSSCGNVAVLATGRVVCSRGGELVFLDDVAAIDGPGH